MNTMNTPTALSLANASRTEIDAVVTDSTTLYWGDVDGAPASYAIVEGPDGKTAQAHATDGRTSITTATFTHDSRAYSLARLELVEIAIRLGWRLEWLDSSIAPNA